MTEIPLPPSIIHTNNDTVVEIVDYLRKTNEIDEDDKVESVDLHIESGEAVTITKVNLHA